MHQEKMKLLWAVQNENPTGVKRVQPWVPLKVYYQFQI